MKCNLCPRNCGVDREKGEKGFCNMPDEVYVARASLHMWEEPCISAEEGSGTVFFSGCNLRCVYCQNRKISTGETGKSVTVERLAEIFLELQKKGANNINIVTGVHYADKIKEALCVAKKNGLAIPVVYNTSGYESVETLKMLEDCVDIYLTDFKYIEKESATKYSKAPDYVEVVKKATDEMVRQKPEVIFDERGIATSGVIVRHLILPGMDKQSKEIIKYLYERYNDKIFMSLMNQFTPLSGLESFPEINRKITDGEYESVIDYAVSIGVENAYIQEGETQNESFIPDFNCDGI